MLLGLRLGELVDEVVAVLCDDSENVSLLDLSALIVRESLRFVERVSVEESDIDKVTDVVSEGLCCVSETTRDSVVEWVNVSNKVGVSNTVTVLVIQRVLDCESCTSDNVLLVVFSPL